MSDRSITLEVAGAGAGFSVHRCELRERIGEPFVATLDCVAYVSGEASAAMELELIGKRATVTLAVAGTTRVYVGLVDSVADEETRSRITVVPRIGWLADTADYRVFVDKSARQIVDAVLSEHGVTVEWKANRTPPRRKQTIQGFESDLAFVTRVLAEEGMCWYQQPDDDAKVCVSDEGDTFVDSGATFPYREEAGLEVDRSVQAAHAVERLATDKVVLRDYDFSHPQNDLEKGAGDGALEHYEFPGGFDEGDAGEVLAGIRLAELRREQALLEGEGTAPELHAGARFSLDEAPDDALNSAWLVVEVTHRLHLSGDTGEMNYRTDFRTVPAERGYRPLREVPVTRRGVTTGVVTGSSGQELLHDQFGRIRAKNRWERRLEADDQASTELRVLQPQQSGAIFNPRVGWEQILAHTDRHGEVPLSLGRVYNGSQPPPAKLPGGKVETHFGTWSTPKGSAGNFTKIDDTAGKEKLLRNAAKDFKERTEKDKVRKVKVNEKRKIAGKRDHKVKERRLETVTGHEGVSITGLRRLTTDSNLQITAASENIIIGGARLFRVGGDYVTITPNLFRLVVGAKGEVAIEQQTITTKGVAATVIGGSMTTKAALGETIGVGGLSTRNVTGALTINAADYSLKVRGLYSENFSNRTATASGNVGENFKTLKFTMRGGGLIKGSEIAFEATSRIIIKAGGCTITITSGDIVVKGAFEGMTPSVEDGNHKYG